ncbi:DUF3105 domain-containing protein [Lapillicoccus sp.]|uniref:DUF3105 domain-containing protein n=1 Tax=Lapillicoccus sp. TaxID=1909287 RepID=UPI003264AC10
MAGKPSARGSDNAKGDRRQLVAEMQAKERSRTRRRLVTRWASFTAVVVAIALAVAVVVVRARGDQPDLSAVSSFTVVQGHVDTPVRYPQSPPVGGQHSPIWLNCGAYGAPVANENAVHSLEHGAVWVTYRPDLPAPQVAALRKTLPSTYAVLSPFPGLQAPVVASAWGKQLVLNGADDPRLDAFVNAYRQGPQTPEPGAACTGGTGNPTPTGN